MPRIEHGCDLDRLAALHARDAAQYLREHPRSVALAARSAPHYLFGLPLHWMRDWPTPSPLHVAWAQGATLECVDGHSHADFCLGDTGAMYGHSPAPVAQAIAEQAALGLTAMLPSALAAEVGARLAASFGLPRWQVTLSASDANRFVLRWARAVTGRRKVLVFDGCYHGTVDDTLVDRAPDRRTLPRASLLGQVHGLSDTVVVPFNDAEAFERALAGGDVACVLMEPALTNCGLVLPAPGFLARVGSACERTGTPWALDETHTLSAGHGGMTRQLGLAPDFLIVGKAIAGGLPAAVYGFTDAMAVRMEAAKLAAPEGHSGIGTTLSANLLAFAALRANLAEVMTPPACAAMNAQAQRLEAGVLAVLQEAGLPWTVTRLGARVELLLCSTLPRDADDARAAMDARIERALHLHLLNRRVLITPFHHMLLVSPATTEAHIDRLLRGLRNFFQEVRP